MKNYKYKFLLLVVLVLVILIIRYLGILDILYDIDSFQSYLLGYGNFGYVIYIVSYMISSVLMVPAFIVTITSGLVFGPFIGAFIAWIGAILGSSLAFITSRYIARDLVVKLFQNNEIFNKIEEGVSKNGKDYIIFTRLVPAFPYNAQNYAYGITNISFKDYFIISAITMMPMCIMYAYMASEIANDGISMKLFWILLASGIIMFILSQIPKIYFKKKKPLDGKGEIL